MSTAMHETGWLSEIRKQAAEHFSRLPIETSQYTTLNLNFDKILSNRNNPEAKIPDSVSALLKDSKRIMVVQLNDKIVHTNIPEHLEKEGVVLCDINEALTKHSGLLEKFFRSRVINPGESKLTAFNYANFSSGVFLYVPSDVIIEHPIYHILAVDGATVIAQTIIIADRLSKFTFVEEDYSTEKEAFHSSLVELHIDDGASVNFVALQDFSQSVTSVVDKKARVSRDASINWIVGRLGAKLNRAKRGTLLAGEGSSVSDTEVFFGRGRQHYDITSNITHQVPNTKGEVLVKGVLKGRARSVSQGMIRVDKNAQKTDSFLAEHTMLLNKDARSDAIPGLEIEANDVRCTHSASVSQIDEEQVFYLKSRGLEDGDARKLIVLGFLDSAFQRMQLGEINERFKALIEEKWKE